MVTALKGLKDGLVDGLPATGQLADQSAAVTAVAYTTAGAISDGDTVVDINNVSKLAMTITKPFAGRILVITQIDAGTAGHTVTLTQGTFDGTNNTATFNAQYEVLVLYGISEKRFLILKNYGSVALSSV